MIFNRASVITTLFSLAQANKLTFPVVQPEYDVWGTMDAQLKAHMPLTNYTTELLAPGWVPESCFNGHYLENIQGRDIDVYNVTFADCAEPFLVCRHKNTKATPKQIFDGLARLNGRLRQWAGNYLAIPTLKPEFAAWQSGPTIVVQDLYWESPGLMIHEMAHAMDLIKLGSGSRGGWDYWTNQAIWRDQFTEDGHVVSSYAKNNYIEAFAEAARVKAYDLIVPGGLAQLPQDQTLVRHQLNMMNVIWSELMLPQCSGKVPSSRMVEVPVSRRRRGVNKRNAPKPDVTVSHVPEIKVPAGIYDMEPHAEEAFELNL